MIETTASLSIWVNSFNEGESLATEHFDDLFGQNRWRLKSIKFYYVEPHSIYQPGKWRADIIAEEITTRDYY